MIIYNNDVGLACGCVNSYCSAVRECMDDSIQVDKLMVVVHFYSSPAVIEAKHLSSHCGPTAIAM